MTESKSRYISFFSIFISLLLSFFLCRFISNYYTNYVTYLHFTLCYAFYFPWFSLRVKRLEVNASKTNISPLLTIHLHSTQYYSVLSLHIIFTFQHKVHQLFLFQATSSIPLPAVWFASYEVKGQGM